MTRCPCGQPLHYANDLSYRSVQSLIDELGPLILVKTPRGAWWVPRHYIALHGLSEVELPRLARELHFAKADTQ